MPEVEAASAEVLNLPLYYELATAQVDDVVDCLELAMRRPVGAKAALTA